MVQNLFRIRKENISKLNLPVLSNIFGFEEEKKPWLYYNILFIYTVIGPKASMISSP